MTTIDAAIDVRPARQPDRPAAAAALTAAFLDDPVFRSSGAVVVTASPRARRWRGRAR